MENKTELITAIDGRSEELSKAISSRRRLLKSGGIAMGAGGALALLLGNEAHVAAQPAINDPGTSIIGLWFSTVSAADNSFPSFQAFEVYGDGIWLSSGQTDLTPAALSSTLWAVFQRVGHRTFRGRGRFWTYDSNANPTGFGAVDQTTTVGEDGNTYYGEGSLQFFDNHGNSLGSPTTINDNGTRIA